MGNKGWRERGIIIIYGLTCVKLVKNIVFMDSFPPHNNYMEYNKNMNKYNK